MCIVNHLIAYLCLIYAPQDTTADFKENYKDPESTSEKVSLINEYSSRLSGSGEEGLRAFLEEPGELLNSEDETVIIETLPGNGACSQLGSGLVYLEGF